MGWKKYGIIRQRDMELLTELEFTILYIYDDLINFWYFTSFKPGHYDFIPNMNANFF